MPINQTVFNTCAFICSTKLNKTTGEGVGPIKTSILMPVNTKRCLGCVDKQ